jgi:hypothetical protein
MDNRLAEPTYSAIEVTKFDTPYASYMKGLFPVFRLPIATRLEEPVNNGKEADSFQREAAALGKVMPYHSINAQLLLVSLENQGKAVRKAIVGLEGALSVAIDHRELDLNSAKDWGRSSISPDTLMVTSCPRGGKNVLLHFAVLKPVFDDLKGR